MTTKEKIIEELSRLDEASLSEVHAVVRRLSEPKAELPSQESIMAKLRRIKINAPPDFSKNLDLYLTGEKTIDDVH